MGLKIHLTAILMSSLLTGGLPFSAQAQSAARCEAVFISSETGKSDGRAFDNLTKYEQIFTKGRGLETYKTALGSEFAAALNRTLARAEAHWFDSGAGHAYAVRQALQMPQAQGLKSTVVAYETAATSTDKLKVISGRFLETVADFEIPKSDLITDVFGPLAYSGQPHQVMQKYFNNLKPDGEIYIFLGARHELYGKTNQVVTAGGKILNLAEWIQTIPGIKADLIRTPKDDDGTLYELWTLRIRKEQNHINVPAVEMIAFKEGAPPAMTFKEIANQGLSAPTTLQQNAKKRFQELTANVTTTQFLDSFRGGELRHPLLASIKNLKREDRWINSTELGDSIVQGLRKHDFDYSDTKVFTGLAQKFIRWRARGIDMERINHTFVRDTQALKDVRKVKLITDYHGDFMSAFAPDVVLKRYVDALSDKGEIYIYLGQEYGGFGSDAIVMTKDGRKLALRQWLRQIPGLNTRLFRGGYHWSGGEWTFVKVQISNRKKVSIPKLKLMGTKDNAEGLPLPLFEEI